MELRGFKRVSLGLAGLRPCCWRPLKHPSAQGMIVVAHNAKCYRRINQVFAVLIFELMTRRSSIFSVTVAIVFPAIPDFRV